MNRRLRARPGKLRYKRLEKSLVDCAFFLPASQAYAASTAAPTSGVIGVR